MFAVAPEIIVEPLNHWYVTAPELLAVAFAVNTVELPAQIAPEGFAATVTTGKLFTTTSDGQDVSV